MNFESIFFDISDFKIGRLISKGNFTKYYIVTDQNDGSKYVSKLYPNEGQVTYSDQIDVLKEVEILYKLQHPSIINFYGVNFQSYHDPSQIRPSIILDYYPNGSLRNIIDKEKKGTSPMEWNLTKKYINLVGICHAMKYIHKTGVLHRNLKPENILLDSNYYPIISDFILSQLFPQPLKKSTQIPLSKPFGTPLYMAPELLLEDEFYGIGVDTYGFAMIAYELLTKKMPGFETNLSLSILIVDRPFYRPHFDKSVTTKMKELIWKCLDSFQDERPSFDEIYEKLSTDFSYFSGEFDKDEMTNYIQNLERDELENNCLINNEEEKENYQIINVIKEGIKSTSYKVVDLRTQKIVFKKVFNIDYEKVELNNIEKAIYEFKVLHSFNHPCICSAIGISSSPDITILKPNKVFSQISLLFEYTEYKLRDCLQFSIFNNTLKTRIAIDILHGMSYLHKRGFVFGVFNIDCIRLNSIFDAKIKIDYFSQISEILDDQNQFKASLLKENKDLNVFISPEIMNNNKNFDNKTDVYSFGVILYSLFYGVPEKPITKEYLDSKTSVSKCCIDLIKKCISNNQRNRPSIEENLIFLRRNNYKLSLDVDSTVVQKRDQEYDSSSI